MIKMLIESSSKGTSSQATKQESGDNKVAAAPSTTTSSSSRPQWTAFRNPRIVRVSRSLGGKDRHSKVCTIRGLRDRRIRLSVPTAIQLYDLQDRLGLSQPSKVIDWLIEATKLDIDKLPPLQFPQNFYPPHHHHQFPMMMSGGASAGAGGGSGGGFVTPPHHQFSLGGGFYDGGGSSYHHQSNLLEKGKWIKSINQEDNNGSYDDDDQDHNHGLSIGGDSSILSAQKLFPLSTNNNSTNNSSSFSGLLNNAAMGYNNNNNYHNSDQNSSLTLSQFGGSHGFLFPSLLDPHHTSSGSGSGAQFSSSLPLATPSPSIFTPYYAPFMANSSMESSSDPRQFSNHVQFLSSSSQVMPFIPSSTLHSMMNSPLGRRIPTPFSSKLLDDSDNNNNNRSGQSDKE